MYAVIFYSLIQDKLSGLQLPIVIYILVILLVFLVSLTRKPVAGYYLTLLGVFFLIISDSILIIEHFVSTFKFASFLITATYVLAQGLIVYGVVDGKNSLHSKNN